MGASTLFRRMASTSSLVNFLITSLRSWLAGVLCPCCKCDAFHGRTFVSVVSLFIKLKELSTLRAVCKATLMFNEHFKKIIPIFFHRFASRYSRQQLTIVLMLTAENNIILAIFPLLFASEKLLTASDTDRTKADN